MLQNKLTRPSTSTDEVIWTTKNWLGLQKQRISVVLLTIAEQIVNELACGRRPSQESLRRLPWCTCVSASARQSRAY